MWFSESHPICAKSVSIALSFSRRAKFSTTIKCKKLFFFFLQPFGIFSEFPFYHFYAQIKTWHKNRADGNPTSATMKRWYWGWRVPKCWVFPQRRHLSAQTQWWKTSRRHDSERMRRDNSDGWGEEGSTQRGLLAGLADSVEERGEQSRIEWLKTVEGGVGEEVVGRETLVFFPPNFQALDKRLESKSMMKYNLSKKTFY